MIGDPELALHLSDLALERGVFAQAIRPPTVPEGTSRLRLTTMATHRSAELVSSARLLGNAARELGIVSAPVPSPEEPDGDRWAEPERREVTTPWLEEAA